MAVNKFETPLYTVAEASRYLGVSDSRFRAWALGYTHRCADRKDVVGEPVVTTIAGQQRGSASVPFVGLAEGLVLAGMRQAGVPLRRTVRSSRHAKASSFYDTISTQDHRWIRA